MLVMIFAAYSLVGCHMQGLAGVLALYSRSFQISGRLWRANRNVFHLYRAQFANLGCRLYGRSNSGRQCRLS